MDTRTRSAQSRQPERERVRRRRRRRWRRRTRKALPWIGGIAAVALGILIVGAALSALSVRRDLAVARSALERGRDQIVDGDAGAALRSFREAQTGFDAASDTTSAFWLRALSFVPIGGRNVDALAGVALAGERVAEAGGTLADAVAGLPEGLASLAPRQGRVPIELLPGLGQATADASVETAGALRELESAPTGWLLGPVGAARAEAETEVRSLNEFLSAGADLLGGLPAFLGAEEPRRYFFGAQNPAELRGTGGVMGAYSIMTIDDGRFSFSPFLPVQTLPRLDPHAVEVSREYAANYDAFRGEGRFWLAINVTPDFPTAARAILGGYEAGIGEDLDGVILADPFALEALLRVMGPVEVPALERSIGADEVVAFTTNEAYAVYRDPATRKRVLGDVATAVFGRFLERTDTGLEDLRALAATASERHLLVYSRDEQVESGLRAIPVGGAFRSETGDLLSVVENSSGGTKVDFYQDRRVRYDVQLFDEGFAKTTTDIWLTNEAPDDGLPRYVIGPNPGYARRGEGGQLVSVYCGGDDCQLERALRDGGRIGVWEGTELGHPFFRDYFRTGSGETSHLSLRWGASGIWQGDDTGGEYRLTFLNQPTIRPTDLEVRVRAPEGMEIVEASPGVEVDGGVATWRGDPTSSLELFLRFEPPLPLEIWRSLT